MSVVEKCEERTITKNVVVERIVKCDVCRQIVKDRSWKLTTSNDAWNNDSSESVEYFDLCSKGCILMKLDDYFKDCESSRYNGYTHLFELEG